MFCEIKFVTIAKSIKLVNINANIPHNYITTVTKLIPKHEIKFLKIVA